MKKTNGPDVEINPRTKLIEVELLELPRVCPFYPMASAGAEELRCTHRGSRRKLKTTILESTAAKVRKVWRSDRMISPHALGLPLPRRHKATLLWATIWSTIPSIDLTETRSTSTPPGL